MTHDNFSDEILIPEAAHIKGIVIHLKCMYNNTFGEYIIKLATIIKRDKKTLSINI